MKKEIVYLVGLPCSGKSTYINEHFKDHAIISNDIIVEEYAEKNGVDYSDAWKSLSFPSVKAECQKRFYQAVQEGRSIIIDNTNMTAYSRQLYNAPGYEKNAVVFEIDDVERKRRAEKRYKETGKLIPEDAIKRMKASYQPPTAAEGFKNISIVKSEKKVIYAAAQVKNRKNNTR